VFARALYRILLLAFPADVRRRRGAAMAAMFVEQSTELRGRPVAQARLWVSAVGDAIAHGLAPRVRMTSPPRALWDALAADVRYTLSSARRSRGFFATALITFGLGIGVTTAMMSAAYAVLLKPLPYVDPDRIVQLWREHPGAPAVPGDPVIDNVTLYAWRDHMTSLDQIGLFGQRDYTVRFAGQGGDTIRAHGAEVSPAIFEILGVQPQLGRLLVGADDVPGHHDFVVLSDRLWRERFNASREIVGQTITVDDRPQRVVGIAPPGFAFPDGGALMWTPFDDPTILDKAAQGGIWNGSALGRMAAHATLAQVAGEGTAIARAMPPTPEYDILYGAGAPVEIRARTLMAQTTGRVKPAMLVLVVGVIVVLLVGCANVTNLLLARGVARERELTLRTAIGASRGRLVRQLLTESLVLATGGGVLGVAIATILLKAAASAASLSVPRLSAVRMDGTTLGIAIGLSCVVALIAGLVPALRGARVDLAGALRGADGAVAGGFRSQHAHVLRRLLLAAETALAVMLLVGAALVGRSFLRLIQVDAGYTPAGVLSVRTFAPDSATPEQYGAFMYGLTERLRTDGRVVAAGAGNMMPFSLGTTVTQFQIPAAAGKGRDVLTRVAIYVVTPGYAEALSLRVRAGRFLHASDASAGTSRIVVNDEFVRQYLMPDRVIGVQLPPRRAGLPPMEIVGVVAPQYKDGNDRPVLPEMYVIASAAPRLGGNEIDVLIKSTGDPSALVGTVRELARDVDPSMVVGEAIPLDRRLQDSVSQPRFAAGMLTMFAVVALALAAIGVYGVLSYSVSQRARELAIRAALGAQRGRLVGMVFLEGLAVTAAGGAAGLAASALVTRLMTSMLFGVSPLDPVSFLLAPLALVPVAALACVIPAAAAARTNPSVMLRR
jgi:predicted permease